jgi:hypothetical protein
VTAGRFGMECATHVDAEVFVTAVKPVPTRGKIFMVPRARSRWFVILQAAVAAIGLAVPAASSAGTFGFNFAGPGVSGRIDLTYGSTTDAKYPSPGLSDVAYEVTGISGFFTDTNEDLNIVNAPITGLAPLNVSLPKPENQLAPANFSKFFIVTGANQGRVTYDNLFWPGGSPATASGDQWAEYKGGYFDIYGLLFEIEGGYTVNFWNVQNNDYGLAVATAAEQFDYVRSGVSMVPEIDPNGVGSVLALVAGCLGLLERRRLMAKLA